MPRKKIGIEPKGSAFFLTFPLIGHCYMDEFRVGGVFADYNLTKPEKEDAVEYRIQQSLWDDIERLQQELKEEKKGRFEARVRCLELEEKLKKLNCA